MSSTDPDRDRDIMQLAEEINAAIRNPPLPPRLEARIDRSGAWTLSEVDDDLPSHSGQWLCVENPDALIDAEEAR